ncbi:MAG: NAD(P)H-hydrate dehydratase [Phycisphaerae bacterium]
MTPSLRRVKTVPSLSPRPADAHKGTFGHVLVVGGSRGMIGAPALAANAALRGGAGLVTFAAPSSVQLTVAGLCPCATSVPLASDADGNLDRAAVGQAVSAAEAADVIAAGPGLSVGNPQRDTVQAMLTQAKPVVLDADGLNNLTHLSDWPASRSCPLLLTPHPGEFARLTGRSVGEIQSDRESAAVEAACAWNGRSGAGAPLVVLLKGAGTVVTDGERTYVNDTGNPALATGGSGDVLTGLAAAFIAQGLDVFEAACLAARVHGLSGDRGADRLGEVSLTAWDLLDFIPVVMR